MHRRLKLEQGVITVLVSSLLTGFLSLGTISLEAGRYQVAKTQLSEASISASTSMIAAYDAVLYERYGLVIAILNKNILLNNRLQRFNAADCPDCINAGCIKMKAFALLGSNNKMGLILLVKTLYQSIKPIIYG